MLGIGPRMDTITLTAGSRLEIPEWQLSGSYPAGSTAQLVITDDAAITLATFDGTVTARGISFAEEAADVADIEHGSNFILFVTYPGQSALALRQGKVIRQEPRYPLTPPEDETDYTVQYTADFVGSYIGPRWIPMGGTGMEIHTHSLISEVPSMGPKYAFFNQACAKWYAPMHMDSVSINVRVLNVGAGRFNVIVCGDYAMTEWLAISFETGITNNKVHVIKGNSPLTADFVGDPVNNTVANGDTYKVVYNHLGQTLSCYKNGNLSTPIISGDVAGLVPHGEGFRHVGLSWSTSLFTPGVEPTAWEARDGI